MLLCRVTFARMEYISSGCSVLGLSWSIDSENEFMNSVLSSNL